MDVQGLFELVRSHSLSKLKKIQDLTTLSQNDEFNQTILHVAVNNGFEDIVRWLVAVPSFPFSHQDKSGWTSLHVAAYTNRIDLCLILLEFVNPRIVTVNKSTFLHFMAKVNLAQWAELSMQVIKISLSAGLDINARNEYNETPLMLACFHGIASNVRLLLDAGADVGCRSITGYTSIDYARRRPGNDETMSLLYATINPFDSQWMPEEILYLIFSLLDGRTLACVNMVCKRFQSMGSTEELWKNAYYTLFPRNHDFPVKDYKLMYKNCTLSGKIPLNQVYEHLIKIIVIGERKVGKSSLISRYVDGVFKSDDQSDRAVAVQMIKVGEVVTKLQIWDTKSGDNWMQMRGYANRGGHIVLVLFDVTSRASFENVKRWHCDIQQYAPQGCSLVMVGTMIDRELERQVEEEEAQNFAEVAGMPYFEVSSKTDENVDQMFKMIIADKIAYISSVKSPLDSSRLLAPRHEKKKGKCNIM